MKSTLVLAKCAFALGLILSSLASIMTTIQVMSEGFSVSTAITGLLGVIVMVISFRGLLTTSKRLGRAG